MPLIKRRGVSLSSFVRGIVAALCEGQQAMPQSRMDHFKHHMKKDDKGTYHPKLIEIEIEEGRRISVPTYSLSQVNVIGISKARVTCAARLVDLEQIETKDSLAHDGQVCKFYVNPALKGSKSVEIEIEFCQRPHSESEHRLLESLDSMVSERNDDD